MKAPAGRYGLILLLALLAVAAGAAWLNTVSQAPTVTPGTRDSAVVTDESAPTARPVAATEAAGILDGENSIVVLPLMLRAGARDETRLGAENFHHSLAWRLSGLRSLRVVSPRSARYYRSGGTAAARVGAELNTEFVLESVAEQEGALLRAGTQLIHAASGQTIWSGSWDGTAGADFWFRVESETARAITLRLDIEPTPQEAEALERRPTRNDAAWSAYLEGTRPGARRSSQQALQHLLRAVQLDSSFAEAWTELGLAAATALGEEAQNPAANATRAEDAIGRALKIDPGLARAWAALGYFRHLRGLPDASNAFETAVELNPGDLRTLALYGEALLDADQPERAEELFQKITQNDPLAPAAWFALGRARDRLGQFDRAREAFQHLREMRPDDPLGYVSTGMGLVAQGRLDEALYWMDRAWRVDPGNVEVAAWMVRLLDSLQDHAAADAWASWLASRVTRQSFPLAMLARHAYLAGEFQTALQFANLAARLQLEDRADARAVFARIKRDEALVLTDPASGIRQLGRDHPELLQPSPAVDHTNLPLAVNLSLLLKLSGKTGGADQMSRAVLQVFDQPFIVSGSERSAWEPLKAEALAVMGREPEAIEALRQAVDSGWRIDWYWATELNTAFNGVRDTPAFREIVDGLTSEAAFQRVQVESLRRSGEIGPAP